MKFNYRLMNTDEDVKVEVSFKNERPDSILVIGENEDYDFDTLTSEDQQCIIDMINCKHMNDEEQLLGMPEFDWD